MALNESEVAQIQRAGDHFKKVLNETFDVLPRSARTIAGLARWSGVNKSTCQRLVQAFTKTQSGLDVIVTLPGIHGLHQLYDSFLERLSNPQNLERFQQMTGQYEDLILKFATSQSDLKRQLEKYQNQTSGSLQSYSRVMRKNAYETNRELTGESVDLYLSLVFTRVNPRNNAFIDEFIIANKTGVELAHSARPFVQNFGGNLAELTVSHPLILSSAAEHRVDDSKSQEFLLSEYSTPGIEQTYAGVANLKNALVYDQTLPPINGGRFNITTAHFDARTQPNPLMDDYKVVCQSLMQRSPAKKIALVTFMERELGQQARVQGGCYPSSIKVHEKLHQPEDLWCERFSESPEIQLINPDDPMLNSKLNVDFADELLANGFAMLGANPKDYMGYMMCVDYPVWLTSHRFYFVL
ncbi:hypothetical protein [Pleionea litopenaei]|uniref:Uncharacterized protein n=1 Tax=Pleionea litopenaei TaxID=3070815 RepID=A0AA51RT19_9GAMM|nr:hypothetical protein [Pleionea sp. HL-JVS1]WMS87091.1 hypothetical protein Q9312_17935 [Pleionea sp. HL-JVS1]